MRSAILRFLRKVTIGIFLNFGGFWDSMWTWYLVAECSQKVLVFGEDRLGEALWGVAGLRLLGVPECREASHGWGLRSREGVCSYEGDCRVYHVVGCAVEIAVCLVCPVGTQIWGVSVGL